MKVFSKQFIWSAVVLLCLLVVSGSTLASDKEDGVLQYNIPVVAGAERFVSLLEYPTYLMLALQNNGISIVGNLEGMIKDWQTFNIKGIEFKFIKKEGGRYFYQANLDLSVMAGKAPPSLTMVVDVSGLSKKLVAVSVSSSLVKYLPENVREIIRAKIQTLASDPNQKKLITYFNKLASISNQKNTIQSIYEGIVIDAYNMHVNGNGAPSGAIGKMARMSDLLNIAYIVAIFLVIMLVCYLFKKFKGRK